MLGEGATAGPHTYGGSPSPDQSVRCRTWEMLRTAASAVWHTGANVSVNTVRRLTAKGCPWSRQARSARSPARDLRGEHQRDIQQPHDSAHKSPGRVERIGSTRVDGLQLAPHKKVLAAPRRQGASSVRHGRQCSVGRERRYSLAMSQTRLKKFGGAAPSNRCTDERWCRHLG